MTRSERAVTMGCCKLSTCYRATHIVVMRTRLRGITVRAIRMAVMPMIATIPVVCERHYIPTTPPIGVIIPVPRRCPTYPERIPEPVIDIRTVDIYGFDDIVRTVDIFVAYNLRSDLTCALVFLYILLFLIYRLTFINRYFI